MFVFEVRLANGLDERSDEFGMVTVGGLPRDFDVFQARSNVTVPSQHGVGTGGGRNRSFTAGPSRRGDVVGWDWNFGRDIGSGRLHAV